MASDNPKAGGAAKLQLLFRSLRHRNYRLFFLGHGTSLIGTWMQRVAMLWLVNSMFPDKKLAAFWLGIVGFAGQIPGFLLTPLAGVLADRLNRRQAILATQFLAMVQAVVLASLTFADAISIGQIIVLAVFLGVVHAVDIPMRQSFMIEIIDRPEDLHNAIALNSSIVNGGRLIGPAIGGLLTAVVGPAVCFLINAISYLAVIGGLLAMRLRPAGKRREHKRFLHGLVEGMRYSYGFAPIRSVLLLMTVVSLTGISCHQLFPVFAEHVLHGDSRTLGLLMASVGVGALVGAYRLAVRESVRGLGRVIASAPALMGAGLILFAWSRWLWASLLLMLAVGFGQMMQTASSNTVLQTIVDDDKRGRVMSLYALSFMGMTPLGSLLMGLLASWLGPERAVAIAGVCCMLGSVWFAFKLPALRKLVHPIYVKKGIIPAVAAGLQAASEPAVPQPGSPANPSRSG